MDIYFARFLSLISSTLRNAFQRHSIVLRGRAGTCTRTVPAPSGITLTNEKQGHVCVDVEPLWLPWVPALGPELELDEPPLNVAVTIDGMSMMFYVLCR